MTSANLSVFAASILTGAGGSLDAWVYLQHGHVFANAQTGNVVLFAVHLAAGEVTAASRHVPSMLAFILGLVLSRFAGAWLKRVGLNSRNVRLSFECVLLVALALIANGLSDEVVTACVGFVAAVQITSFSHIGDLTFNTGMTTGNLRGAFSAASAVWYDPEPEHHRARATALGLMCLAFMAGALIGGFCTMRFGEKTLYITAVMVACAILLLWRTPDPVASFAQTKD